MEKHTAYFNLLEQLKEPGCPVCGQVKKSVAGFLDSYLYEGVTDRNNWNRLVASDGYCPRHCAMLEEFSDGLAVSLFYGHLYKQRLAALGKKEKRGLFARPPKPSPCPACDYEEGIEEGQCRLLAQAVEEGDEAFTRGLKENKSLCLRHARKAAGLFGGAVAGLARDMFAPLVAELDEFVAKSDHRNREKMGPEGDGWQRALRRFHGLRYPGGQRHKGEERG